MWLLGLVAIAAFVVAFVVGSAVEKWCWNYPRIEPRKE
jgi:hypothetical protein